jgi:hypothetical protein
MAKRALTTETIPCGLVEISDAALPRLRSELEQKAQGVVDEMGVLAIHATLTLEILISEIRYLSSFS